MKLTNEQIKEKEAEIKSLLGSVKRPGMNRVLQELENARFYTERPFTSRHHRYVGGLAEHSLGVYKIASRNGYGLPYDSIVIAALLHDVCKAHNLFPTLGTFGHGYRSVKIVEACELELTPQERRAIRWHMNNYPEKGTSEEKADFNLAHTEPLWQVVHKADGQDVHEFHKREDAERQREEHRR
jgi:Predicted HD-superfamily hydrolase